MIMVLILILIFIIRTCLSFFKILDLESLINP